MADAVVLWGNGLDLFYALVDPKIDWGQRLQSVAVSLPAWLGLDAGVVCPLVRLGDLSRLDAPLLSLDAPLFRPTAVTSVAFSFFLVADVTTYTRESPPVRAPLTARLVRNCIARPWPSPPRDE